MNHLRKNFPIFHEHPELIYLDNASTTHKPQQVLDAMSEYVSHYYSNIHRGQYSLAEQSELLYMQSKKKVAEFIGGDYREIIYTYNATHSSNILAQSLVVSLNIGVGDMVLVGIRDHHATIVPRQLLSEQFGFQVQFIDIEITTGEVDWAKLKKQLHDHKVKALICSHVSNVTGKIYDIQKIKSLLSDDIFFAVDGSQAVPHFQVDVKNSGANAYFFTGHKMMGPTGLGVLWIQKEWSRTLQTLQGGGGIIDAVSTEGCSLIRTADKFEPGTPNLIGAIGLGAACDFYDSHDIYADIKESYVIRQGYYCTIIDKVGKEKIIGGLGEDKVGILSLYVPNYEELGEKLAVHNVCVRVGGHCAHPLLTRLNLQHGVVRISPFVYTNEDDLEKLVQLI